MGGKKKYIEMFGSFTEPFSYFRSEFEVFGKISVSIPSNNS